MSGLAKTTSCERRLAEAYCKLLRSIDWSDELVVAGIREGLNKFLSNAFLSMFPSVHKYHRTHLISRNALRQVETKNYRRLVYEHLVPKTNYIQRPCEERAIRGDLTVDSIEDLLRRYWRVATITKAEDERLHRRGMPTDWDGVNVLARYEAAGIKLIPNPYFGALTEA